MTFSCSYLQLLPYTDDHDSDDFRASCSYENRNGALSLINVLNYRNSIHRENSFIASYPRYFEMMIRPHMKSYTLQMLFSKQMRITNNCSYQNLNLLAISEVSSLCITFSANGIDVHNEGHFSRSFSHSSKIFDSSVSSMTNNYNECSNLFHIDGECNDKTPYNEMCEVKIGILIHSLVNKCELIDKVEYPSYRVTPYDTFPVSSIEIIIHGDHYGPFYVSEDELILNLYLSFIMYQCSVNFHFPLGTFPMKRRGMVLPIGIPRVNFKCSNDKDKDDKDKDDFIVENLEDFFSHIKLYDCYVILRLDKTGPYDKIEVCNSHLFSKTKTKTKTKTEFNYLNYNKESIEPLICDLNHKIKRFIINPENISKEKLINLVALLTEPTISKFVHNNEISCVIYLLKRLVSSDHFVGIDFSTKISNVFGNMEQRFPWFYNNDSYTNISFFKVEEILINNNNNNNNNNITCVGNTSYININKKIKAKIENFSNILSEAFLLCSDDSKQLQLIPTAYSIIKEEEEEENCIIISMAYIYDIVIKFFRRSLSLQQTLNMHQKLKLELETDIEDTDTCVLSSSSSHSHQQIKTNLYNFQKLIGDKMFKLIQNFDSNEFLDCIKNINYDDFYEWISSSNAITVFEDRKLLVLVYRIIIHWFHSSPFLDLKSKIKELKIWPIEIETDININTKVSVFVSFDKLRVLTFNNNNNNNNNNIEEQLINDRISNIFLSNKNKIERKITIPMEASILEIDLHESCKDATTLLEIIGFDYSNSIVGIDYIENVIRLRDIPITINLLSSLVRLHTISRMNINHHSNNLKYSKPSLQFHIVPTMNKGIRHVISISNEIEIPFVFGKLIKIINSKSNKVLSSSLFSLANEMVEQILEKCNNEGMNILDWESFFIEEGFKLPENKFVFFDNLQLFRNINNENSDLLSCDLNIKYKQRDIFLFYRRKGLLIMLCKCLFVNGKVFSSSSSSSVIIKNKKNKKKELNNNNSINKKWKRVWVNLGTGDIIDRKNVEENYNYNLNSIVDPSSQIFISEGAWITLFFNSPNFIFDDIVIVNTDIPCYSVIVDCTATELISMMNPKNCHVMYRLIGDLMNEIICDNKESNVIEKYEELIQHNSYNNISNNNLLTSKGNKLIKEFINRIKNIGSIPIPYHEKSIPISNCVWEIFWDHKEIKKEIIKFNGLSVLFQSGDEDEKERRENVLWNVFKCMGVHSRIPLMHSLETIQGILQLIGRGFTVPIDYLQMTEEILRTDKRINDNSRIIDSLLLMYPECLIVDRHLIVRKLSECMTIEDLSVCQLRTLEMIYKNSLEYPNISNNNNNKYSDGNSEISTLNTKLPILHHEISNIIKQQTQLIIRINYKQFVNLEYSLFFSELDALSFNTTKPVSQNTITITSLFDKSIGTSVSENMHEHMKDINKADLSVIFVDSFDLMLCIRSLGGNIIHSFDRCNSPMEGFLRVNDTVFIHRDVLLKYNGNSRECIENCIQQMNPGISVSFARPCALYDDFKSNCNLNNILFLSPDSVQFTSSSIDSNDLIQLSADYLFNVLMTSWEQMTCYSPNNVISLSKMMTRNENKSYSRNNVNSLSKDIYSSNNVAKEKAMAILNKCKPYMKDNIKDKEETEGNDNIQTNEKLTKTTKRESISNFLPVTEQAVKRVHKRLTTIRDNNSYFSPSFLPHPTSQTQCGILAEAYVYRLLCELYQECRPSWWVSGLKLESLIIDKKRKVMKGIHRNISPVDSVISDGNMEIPLNDMDIHVDDTLGYDFCFEDTIGLFDRGMTPCSIYATIRGAKPPLFPKMIYLEVKGSHRSCGSDKVIISANEIHTSQYYDSLNKRMMVGGNAPKHLYVLLIVKNTLTNPRIHRVIPNLLEGVRSGDIGLEPTSFNLTLQKGGDISEIEKLLNDLDV